MEKNNRIIFIIMALAWFVILGPLIIAMIINPDIPINFEILLAIGIASTSFIGAVAIIFYKQWGVILYAISSTIFIIYALYNWWNNIADGFPWMLLIINFTYAGMIMQSRDKFGFAKNNNNVNE